MSQRVKTAECPGCARRAIFRGDELPPLLILDDRGRFREHFHQAGRCEWSGFSPGGGVEPTGWNAYTMMDAIHGTPRDKP